MKRWRVVTDLGDWEVDAWSAQDAARRVYRMSFGRQKVLEVKRI